jgi:hypothetical protein
MRKFQQRQVLEILKTIKTAQNVKLYAECQNAALSLCDFIEKIEGVHANTVVLLEEYCELLFKANSGEIKEKVLLKHMQKIENTAKHDLKPRKIEIAFFPYKASMFDAFESIWRMAKDDPQCDVHVVPIPYFDRLPGGAFGKMNYEGHLFDADIPIENYTTYDVEKHRPDIIFIHNPFDAANYVTSVHPNYYSERLKNYCELLCFIPYFVAAGDIEPLGCINAGILYSDKIFVQSERVRKSYIREFKDFEKNNNCVGRFGDPDRKIIAAGSPKFDKIINAKPDQFNLPEHWRNLIEQPNNLRKKIVLLNTTLAAMLKDSENHVKKLRSTLEVFQKRKDVVLWWRPHPLSEATFDSMRPQLCDEYKKIVSDYKRLGWGIYDDTSDVHRALCNASMLYGDGGSLIPLFQCQEKPILMPSYAQPQKQELNLPVSCICDVGGVLWVLFYRCNALCKLDKKTWELEYIGSFPGEAAYAWIFFSDMVSVDSFLYFTPCSANDIAVYNMKSQTFQKIKIPDPDKKIKIKVAYNQNTKFLKLNKVNGCLFFIPYSFPGILMLDTSNNMITLIDSWIEPLNKIVIDSALGYFATAVFDAETNRLLLPCLYANAVVALDIATNETTIIELNENKNGYIDIIKIEQEYWLISYLKPSITRWEPKNNSYEEYDLPPYEGTPDDGLYGYQKFFYKNDTLFIIPFCAKNIIAFNLTDKTFSIVESFNPESQGNDEKDWLYPHNYLFTQTVTKENIYMNTGKSNHFIEFNPTTGYYREEKLQLKGEELKRFQKNLAMLHIENEKKPLDCIFSDDPDMNLLEGMLDAITEPALPEWISARVAKQAELQRREIVSPNGKAGAEIFKICKKIIFE